MITKKESTKINKTMQYETLLCVAFPGTGKSYFYNHSYKKVLDSDSSKFDKSEFPQNYIKHIKQNIGKVDVICVSSHKEVRDELVKEGIEFTLVYPYTNLKDEYLKRYKDRGSADGFIKLIDSNWNDWILQLRRQNDCKHITLKSGQYISDVL